MPRNGRSCKAGLIQRAELLEAILADIYGPANLVREGRLPAAVVAGNPEFLRSLVGIEPSGGAHLRFYGVDVGRSPDGRWWVLGDRTQAPSGAGYALENRLALSRAMPDIYRQLRVERVAPFFQAFQADLSALSRRDDSPVCVLTPGPMNETYFEHAYLARYLGFLLVEGEDLTVRDDGVFIRTVSGLKRAEVLLRRLDSDFADPLELSARSRLGVPGLVQAIRDGTVVMANALGSGVVEARAMLSFLPALAPAVLGRELMLPNVATWWLGDPAVRDDVMQRPRRPRDRAGLLRRSAAAHRPAGRHRQGSRCRRARARRRGDRPPRHRLRRAGGGDAVDHAGLGERPARAAAVQPAAAAGAERRWLAGHARRLCPHRRRARCARHQSAAGRPHRRRLDPVGQAGRADHAAADAGPDQHQSHHRRAAEPGRLQPVLARPLRRAHRGDASPGAGAGQPRDREHPEPSATSTPTSWRCSAPGRRCRKTC